jgi:DNA-binding GntR family transcriptional regulator
MLQAVLARDAERAAAHLDHHYVMAEKRLIDAWAAQNLDSTS